jgi:hypothetical protein
MEVKVIESKTKFGFWSKLVVDLAESLDPKIAKGAIKT